MLSRHTQVENLTDLLHLRRSTQDGAGARTYDDAHLELLAAILSEPPESRARRRVLAARVEPQLVSQPKPLPARLAARGRRAA